MDLACVAVTDFSHQCSRAKFLMSRDGAFRAEELVDRLLHAFETPTGIPYNQLNLHTLQGKNPGWTAKMSTLAGFPFCLVTARLPMLRVIRRMQLSFR